MSSVTINNMAMDVLDSTVVKTDKEKYSFIDPITILMIISITVGIIRIIQECRKDKLKKLSKEDKADLILHEIRIAAANPGFITKWRVQRIMKRTLSKEQYKVCKDSMFEAFRELGERITEEQVSSLLEYKNV
jgi:hypothetical protein